MNGSDMPRPVSGEIMTPATTAASRRLPAHGVTEAEFETLAQPPRHAPAPARDAAAGAAGMEILKTEETPAPRRGGPPFWLAGAVLVLAAFWISGGHTLLDPARFAPPAGVRSEPLVIIDVESHIGGRSGARALFVEGAVENRGQARAAVPDLEIAVSSPDGAVARYNLGTNASVLEPGGRHGFSIRLEAPRNGVRLVSVAFREKER